jgi:hypothetical protein
MYHVFRQLPDGQLVSVDSRNSLEEAVDFVDGLNTDSGKYLIQDSDGNDVAIIRRPLSALPVALIGIRATQAGRRRSPTYIN